jgi:acetoin utilization protein AcuB
MFVSMWMSKELVTANADDSVSSIAELMRKHRIRRVPIVSKDDPERLLGIVSHTDVMHAFPLEVAPSSAAASTAEAVQKHRASDVMTANPVSTTPEAPIELAAQLMREHKIGALPVLHDGRLLGLITESDIFQAFVSMIHPEKASVRITFEIREGENVFPLIAKIAEQRGLQVNTFVCVRQHDRPLGMLQVTGPKTDQAIDDFWKSHHRVVNVQHLGTGS